MADKLIFPHIKPSRHNLLFWQPGTDVMAWLLKKEYGNMLIVLWNYFIWFFLLFIYYLIVARSANAFWQVLLAVIVGEQIEKYGKSHGFWRRPLYHQSKTPPPGLVRSWYETGSFPSGHTIKSVFFFLFALQYRIFNPMVYVLISLPVIIFRVLVGFHYPIDILGGVGFGVIIWYLFKDLTMPQVLNDFITAVYNFIFLTG